MLRTSAGTAKYSDDGNKQIACHLQTTSAAEPTGTEFVGFAACEFSNSDSEVSI